MKEISRVKGEVLLQVLSTSDQPHNSVALPYLFKRIGYYGNIRINLAVATKVESNLYLLS